MTLTLQEAIERVKNSKYAFGICSDVGQTGNHVLFFDFDGDISFDKVKNSLMRTILVYTLSDVYILKSDNGYNAFCLNILDLKTVYDILNNTDYVCQDFIKIGYEKRKFYVLRMSYSKTYLTCLRGYKNKSFLSNAHRWFFDEIMNFPINNNQSYDNNTSLKFIAYKSPKHGTVNLDAD